MCAKNAEPWHFSGAVPLLIIHFQKVTNMRINRSGSSSLDEICRGLTTSSINDYKFKSDVQEYQKMNFKNFFACSFKGKEIRYLQMMV